MYTDIIQQFLATHDYVDVTPGAALIDMDGTLYDSMPRHALAWEQMLAEIGLSIPREMFFRFEGRTGASTIDEIFRTRLGRAASEDEKQRLYRRKAELFAAMPQVSPMPGAAGMLEFLKNVGIKRVLVTGSGQSSLLNRLDTDFPGAFSADMRITSHNVTYGKPHPEPYLKAMELAGMKPNECLVIENAPLGVEAGHAAGAFTIGLNTGPLRKEELSEAGADIVFDSMQDFARNLPLLIYGLITNSRNLN